MIELQSKSRIRIGDCRPHVRRKPVRTSRQSCRDQWTILRIHWGSISVKWSLPGDLNLSVHTGGRRVGAADAAPSEPKTVPAYMPDWMASYIPAMSREYPTPTPECTVQRQSDPRVQGHKTSPKVCGNGARATGCCPLVPDGRIRNPGVTGDTLNALPSSETSRDLLNLNTVRGQRHG